ncbi:MAG: DUF2244 domain-containing protein [Pseudomonadota bacterium]
MSKATGPTYFDAILTPNRSLSPRAVAITSLAVGAVSLAGGIYFLSVGALPVVGFFGLDALAIWIALNANLRRAKIKTRVTITADDVRLRHEAPGAPNKVASFPTAFARIHLDQPLTHRSMLRLEYGAKGFVIGKFLTLDERKSLAEALKRALAKARMERHSIT